jgi:hypothetical protein
MPWMFWRSGRPSKEKLLSQNDNSLLEPKHNTRVATFRRMRSSSRWEEGIIGRRRRLERRKEMTTQENKRIKLI